MSNTPNYEYLVQIINLRLQNIPREYRRYNPQHGGRIIIDDPWGEFQDRRAIYPFQSKKLKITNRLIDFLVSYRDENTFDENQKEVLRVSRLFRSKFKNIYPKKNDYLMVRSDMRFINTSFSYTKYQSELCFFLNNAFHYRLNNDKPEYASQKKHIGNKESIENNKDVDFKSILVYEDVRRDPGFEFVKTIEASSIFDPILRLYCRNIDLDRNIQETDPEYTRTTAFFNKTAPLMQSSFYQNIPLSSKRRYNRTKWVTKTYCDYHNLVSKLIKNNEIPKNLIEQFKPHAEHPFEKSKTKDLIKENSIKALNANIAHSKIINFISNLLDRRSDMVLMFRFESSGGPLREKAKLFLEKKIKENTGQDTKLGQLFDNCHADGFYRYVFKDDLLEKESFTKVDFAKLNEDYLDFQDSAIKELLC